MPTAIDSKYAQLISTNSWIGKPTIGEGVCADGVGHYRHYEGNASIFWSPQTGAHLVSNSIRKTYASLGWERSPLGYPTSDEADAGSKRGRYNNFQNGTIIWKTGSPESFAVYGDIYKKWGEQNYDLGYLGFPLTNERGTADGKGRYNHFEGGSIFCDKTGTHIVRGTLLNGATTPQSYKWWTKASPSNSSAASIKWIVHDLDTSVSKVLPGNGEYQIQPNHSYLITMAAIHAGGVQATSLSVESYGTCYDGTYEKHDTHSFPSGDDFTPKALATGELPTWSLRSCGFSTGMTNHLTCTIWNSNEKKNVTGKFLLKGSPHEGRVVLTGKVNQYHHNPLEGEVKLFWKN